METIQGCSKQLLLRWPGQHLQSPVTVLHSDGSHIFTLFFRLQNTEITTFYYTKIQAQQSREDGCLHTETHKLGNATNTGAHNNQPRLRSEVMAPGRPPENSHRQPTAEALWGVSMYLPTLKVQLQ